MATVTKIQEGVVNRQRLVTLPAVEAASVRLVVRTYYCLLQLSLHDCTFGGLRLRQYQTERCLPVLRLFLPS